MIPDSIDLQAAWMLLFGLACGLSFAGLSWLWQMITGATKAGIGAFDV
jgi:hypothetical protein